MSNKDKTKANKCLKFMLKGDVLNRKKLGDKGIASNNDSLHSYVSHLRNKRFIPIESAKNDDATNNYFMTSTEIYRFKHSELRPKQEEEMRFIVERERQEKLIDEFSRFLTRLVDLPELWRFWCDLPFRLCEISMKINAILKAEGANQ